MTRVVHFLSTTFPRLDNNLLEQAIAGEAVVYWHKDKLPLKLKQAQFEQLEGACKAGYLVQRRNNDPLRRAFFYRCENARQPEVICDVRTRYAIISMDLISCAHLTDAGVDLARALFLRELPQNRKSYFTAGHVYSHVDRVLLERAEAVALQLVEIWKNNNV